MTGEDAGRYECQVSTVPKLSRSMDLVVVVPKVSTVTQLSRSLDLMMVVPKFMSVPPSSANFWSLWKWSPRLAPRAEAQRIPRALLLVFKVNTVHQLS